MTTCSGDVRPRYHTDDSNPQPPAQGRIRFGSAAIRVETLVEKESFPAGSIGVVVGVYGEGPGCEVEIWDDDDNPIDVVTFDTSELKPLD